MTGLQLLQFSRRCEQLYTKQFESLLAQTGLTMREIHVLLFLVNNPGHDTARDVVFYRGLAKSQVSQAVELLTARGLLSRSPDQGDRRVVHLAITAAGQPLAQQAKGIQSACGQQMLSALTEAEQQQLEHLMEKVFSRANALAEGEGHRES